ncbi:MULTISPECIES: hypothetical protein [Bacteria]|uniref:hypothetical protein n=1 Tax=Bacteria TaxID=2 RepID=UPI001C303D0E|nr:MULTISPECIES: hypothetical protein [Bacteria]
MVEQLTIEDAVVYEQIDTYMVDIVTNIGFKLEFCEAETREDAARIVRERYCKHYDFRIRSIEVSNRSLKEIEALD